jgi:hypothetical protein
MCNPFWLVIMYYPCKVDAFNMITQRPVSWVVEGGLAGGSDFAKTLDLTIYSAIRVNGKFW